MPTTFIALGANLDNRLANLQAAKIRLAAHPKIKITDQSHLYETAPIGGPPGQSAYLNAVINIETSLSPLDLHHLTSSIEQNLGRERTTPNAPRIIDIDILTFGDATIDTSELTIPHPRLHTRLFVLIPFHDIAPTLLIPSLHRTVSQLKTDVIAKLTPQQITEQVRQYRSAGQW
jgi:2-amino-4-hydroxy-6-hydroxymethyldihydropteridine diphosphokinase